jgi:hypothetical protein
MKEIIQFTQIMQSMHKKISAKILELGVTNAAKLLNLHHSDVSAWLHGRRKWSMEKMIKIAGMLGM